MYEYGYFGTINAYIYTSTYVYRVLLRLLLLCVAILLLPLVLLAAAVRHRTPVTRGCSLYKQQY